MLIPLVRFFDLINYLYSLVKAGQLPCPAFRLRAMGALSQVKVLNMPR